MSSYSYHPKLEYNKKVTKSGSQKADVYCFESESKKLPNLTSCPTYLM